MKATKKIVGAALALVAAVALSAGSTFAWFVSNQTVSVAQFSADVTIAGGDLQVAYQIQQPGSGETKRDWSNWKSELTLADIEKAYTVPKDDIEFKPVHLDGVAMKDVMGNAVDNTTAPASGAPNEYYGSYVEFNLKFRSSTDMKLYLVQGSKVESSGTYAVTYFLGDETDPVSKYGKNVHTTTADADSIDGGTCDSGVWDSETNITNMQAKCASRVAFIKKSATVANLWAPYEIDTNGGRYTKAEIEAAGFDGWGGITNFGAYYGNLAGDIAKNAGRDGGTWAGAYPSGTKLVSSDLTTISNATEATDNANSVIATLTAGAEQEWTVRVWIEGGDGDCTNAISGQTLSVTLALYGAPKTFGA